METLSRTETEAGNVLLVARAHLEEKTWAEIVRLNETLFWVRVGARDVDIQASHHHSVGRLRTLLSREGSLIGPSPVVS